MATERSAEKDLVGHSLSSILDDAAAPDKPLASGSAAALTIAVAASIVASVVRAGGEPDRLGLGTQAANLRLRATQLATRNSEAYGAALGALAASKADPGYRDVRIGDALEETIATLTSIADTGADVCVLAAGLCRDGAPETRPDAAGAATLAEAGTRTALLLVEANLLNAGSGKPAEAAAAALAAASAAADDARRGVST